LLPEFLFLWVQSPSFVEQISFLVQGALYPAVTDWQVRELTLPLPTLAEQRRIVAALDAQLASAARARAAVAAQIDAAERIGVALLEEFFPSGENALDQPLDELLAAPLRTGLSKPMLPVSEFRCLTLSAVRNGALDFLASKPVDVTKAEAEANRVRPGAFYVVRGNGNRELVGRGALAPAGSETEMTFPDLLFEIVPDAGRLLPEFLRWAWESRRVRRQIEAKAQTSAGIYKINQGNLRQIRVPVPPLAEQVRHVHELQARCAATRRLIGALHEKRDALDSLPARFLASAFGAVRTHHGQENQEAYLAVVG
jgi:type I restriction enzyme S subunit